tara:strand:- start:760 stop:1227 length:468 start_codon:yes stop_codon:yes gene_type:complete
MTDSANKPISISANAPSGFTPEYPVFKNELGDVQVGPIDITELKDQVTALGESVEQISPIVYNNKDEVHKIIGVLGDPPEDVAYLINELQKKVKSLEATVQQYHERNDAEDNIQQDYDNIIKQNQSSLTQLNENQSSIESTLSIIQDTLKRHGMG